jgi:hypothetical protein
VDLGALGTGEIIVGLPAVEVRVTTGGGHYVRVRGTVPLSMLTDVARSLRAVPGGTLVYL